MDPRGDQGRCVSFYGQPLGSVVVVAVAVAVVAVAAAAVVAVVSFYGQLSFWLRIAFRLPLLAAPCRFSVLEPGKLISCI